MEEYRIKIPKEIDYKIDIGNEIYYPAFLSVELDDDNKPYLRKEGANGIHYFVESGENTLASYMRSIDVKHLNHLDFSRIDNGYLEFLCTKVWQRFWGKQVLTIFPRI